MIGPRELTFWDDQPARLRIAVDALDGDRTLDEAPCEGCGEAMFHRATAHLDDAFWIASRPEKSAAERYDWLDRLERTDISAYSREKAYLDVYGRLSHEHVCLPDHARAVSKVDPTSRFARAQDAIRRAAEVAQHADRAAA